MTTLSLLAYVWDSRNLLTTANSLHTEISSFVAKRETKNNGKTIVPTIPFGLARVHSPARSLEAQAQWKRLHLAPILYFSNSLGANSKDFSSLYHSLEAALQRLTILDHHRDKNIFEAVAIGLSKITETVQLNSISHSSRMPRQWSKATENQLGRPNLVKLHKWWTEEIAPEIGHDCGYRWVSTVQLLLDFLLRRDSHGFRFYGRKLVDSTDGLNPKDWPMLRRARSFSTFLRSFLAGNGLQVPVKYTRPCGAALVVRLLCYRMSWSDASDDFIFSCSGGQIRVLWTTVTWIPS